MQCCQRDSKEIRYCYVVIFETRTFCLSRSVICFFLASGSIMTAGSYLRTINLCSRAAFLKSSTARLNRTTHHNPFSPSSNTLRLERGTTYWANVSYFVSHVCSSDLAANLNNKYHCKLSKYYLHTISCYYNPKRSISISDRKRNSYSGQVCSRALVVCSTRDELLVQT